jgi:DNA-binding beta-propeller fold protein YncE
MAQLNNWVTNLNAPLGIAVDPTNTFLYEIDSATQSINQIDISTGTIGSTPIVATGTFINPVSVVVDPTNTFLYVSDLAAGTISTVLIASPNTVTTWASGLTSPSEIVIDSAGVNMYVATQDGVNGGTITQIPIASPGSPTTFTSGLANAIVGLAIDSAGNNLYVANTDVFGNGVINQIDVTGSITSSDPGTLVTTNWANLSGYVPKGIVLDATNTYLYVAANSNILQIAVATPTQIVPWTNNLASPYSVKLDSTATYMYVSNTSSNTIAKLIMSFTPSSTQYYLSDASANIINTTGQSSIIVNHSTAPVSSTILIDGQSYVGTLYTTSLSPATYYWSQLSPITVDPSQYYLCDQAGLIDSATTPISAIPSGQGTWTSSALSLVIEGTSHSGYLYTNGTTYYWSKVTAITIDPTKYYSSDQSGVINTSSPLSQIPPNQGPWTSSTLSIIIQGNTLSGYLYTNGFSYYWTQEAPVTIDPTQYYSSNQSGVINTSSFISQLPSGQGTWTSSALSISVQGNALSGYLYTNGTTYYWSQVVPISIDPAKYYLCDQTGNVFSSGSLSPISKMPNIAGNTFSASPLTITIQSSNLNGNLFSNSDGTTFYWTQKSVVIPPVSGTFYACNSLADNIPFTNSIPFTSGLNLPPSATYPATYSDTAFNTVVQGNPYIGFLYTDSANGLYYWSSSGFIPSPTLFYPCASNGTIISELGGVSLLPQVGGQWQGYSWSASSGNQTIDGTPYIGYIYANGSNYYWSQVAPFVPSSTVYYPVNSGKGFIDGSGNALNAFAPTESTLPKDQWYGYQYTELIYGTPTPGYFYLNYSGTKFFWSQIKFIPRPVCFKEDTKILAKKSENEEEQWIEVQDLRKGMLVKTVLHDFVKIDMIGNRNIKNPATQERIKDRLYVCKPEKYPELFEDLIITGCHSILVKEITDEEREELVKEMGKIYVTDEHYRLMAMVDKRAEPYTEEGNYTIWHFALENEGYYANYGIYANGLLVETCSKRMLLEISGMNLVE